MQLLSLAARNIRRQRGRSLLILGGIVFGVVALVLAGGFIKDTIVETGESLIHSQSGHLQVSLAGFRTEGAGEAGEYLLPQPQALRQQLRQPGVEEVLLRLSFSGLLNNGRNDWVVMIEGVEPEAEARLGTYINLAAGRQLGEQDPWGMMLGAGVAGALGVAVGDWLNLLAHTPAGAVNVLEFQVVGIFQSFSKDYDARAVRIALPAAQQLLDSAGAHLAVLRLSDTALTEEVEAQLAQTLDSEAYEVVGWQTLNPFYGQTLELYLGQFGFLLAVILLVMALSVGNAINMNVHERAAEFGTMMACGAPRREVSRLILLESALLGLAGALFGLLLGNGLALVISAIGIPMPPPPNSDLGYTALVLLDWRISLCAAAVGLLAPLVAALLPARRASRAVVVDALRQAV